MNYNSPLPYSAYNDFYRELLENYDKTQITISNDSDQEREINLWGMNKGDIGSVSTPLITDVQDHVVLRSLTYSEVQKTTGQDAIAPQGMLYNPVDGYLYITNRGSHNITVLDENGEVIKVVPLQTGAKKRILNPIGLAVNTNKNSKSYGYVYVANTAANMVTIINREHKIAGTVTVGSNPIAIGFNPVTFRIYVSNYYSKNVSVIDTETNTLVKQLTVGDNPIGLAFNPENGDTYVANLGNHTVSVFNQSDLLVTTIDKVLESPINVIYHPITKEMWVATEKTNKIYPIDTTTNKLLPAINVGIGPSLMVFNSNNKFMYVGNHKENTITIIKADKSIVASLKLGDIDKGMAIHPKSNLLFISSPYSRAIDIIGYSKSSKSVLLNEDYYQEAMDFKYNPIIIKHTKWILSGKDRFKVLRVIEQSPTGKKKSFPISHESYHNPQNSLNVSEITELDGIVLDGKTEWKFTIAPKQTITIMLYYKQFNMLEKLKENIQ